MRVLRLEVTGTVDDDRGSGALLGAGEIVLVLGKGQVARLGAVRGGKALEHQRSVADDFAAEQFGNFSSGIRHKLLTWTTGGHYKGRGS